MALKVKHKFTSQKSDGQDLSLIQPSNWNDEHDITVFGPHLVGRSEGEGPAEEIAVEGLTLEDGVLSNPMAGMGGVDTLVGSTLADSSIAPNARVVTNTPSIEWDKTTANQIKANIPSGAVTLAQMDHGTHGAVLIYGAGGVAKHLAPGTAGQSLTSNGPDADPSWGGSGAPHAVIWGQKVGVEGTFASGAWKTRLINTAHYDLNNIVLIQGQGTPAVGTHRFRLLAGTYVVEWSAPAFDVGVHQSRLLNFTDNVFIGYGTSESSSTENPNQTRSVGIRKFTIAANKDLELQHQCATDSPATNGFGVASPFTAAEDVFSIIKIWKVG